MLIFGPPKKKLHNQTDANVEYLWYIIQYKVDSISRRESCQTLPQISKVFLSNALNVEQCKKVSMI